MDDTPEKPRPTQEEVVAWMRDTGKGYRSAAAHFGMSASTTKLWDRQARRGIVKKTRPPYPEPIPDPPPLRAADMRDAAGDLALGRRADIIRRRLRGETLRTIARAHGVTVASVSNHLATEEARRLLAEVRASVVPELVADIQERAPAVVDTLYAIARGTKMANLGQVQAGIALLKFAGVEERTVVVQDGEVGLRMRVDDMTPDQVDAEIKRLEAASNDGE